MRGRLAGSAAVVLMVQGSLSCNELHWLLVGQNWAKWPALDNGRPKDCCCAASDAFWLGACNGTVRSFMTRPSETLQEVSSVPTGISNSASANLHPHPTQFRCLPRHGSHHPYPLAFISRLTAYVSGRRPNGKQQNICSYERSWS